MSKKKVVEALKVIGTRLRETLVDGIIEENLLKTGKLARSVKDEVVVNPQDGVASLNLTMVNYGVYQDSGVKGYGSNNTVVANAESLFPPGQFKSTVIGGPLPFPIRKSIAEKGLKPRPFIKPSVSKNINYISETLLQAGSEDIQVQINDLGKKYGAEVII